MIIIFIIIIIIIIIVMLLFLYNIMLTFVEIMIVSNDILASNVVNAKQRFLSYSFLAVIVDCLYLGRKTCVCIGLIGWWKNGIIWNC